MSSDEDESNGSADGILAAAYRDLRRLAAAQLKHQRRGHTLQATALVNEAYIKLADYDSLAATSREKFYRIASGVMRNVLVDHARA